MINREPRPQRTLALRSLVSIFATGVAAAAIGVLINIVAAGPEILARYNALMTVFVAVSFALLILVGMIELAFQIRDDRRQNAAHLQQISNRENLHRSVSTLVTFIERRERITVTESGNGIFDCTYRVLYDPGDHASGQDGFVEHLHFPVIIDLSDEKAAGGSKVKVKKIEIDGDDIPVDGQYVPQELRKRLHKRDGEDTLPQEYGVVIVPVALSVSRPERRIRIITEYSGIFGAQLTGDYVIVDIPYLTRSLEVTICPESSASSIWPPTRMSAIEATGEMMDLDDELEAREQAKGLSRTNNGIKWATSSSKIGYRYRIYFRVAAAGGGIG